jgi:hypothetical protein
MSTSQSSLETFVEEAMRFEHWARSGTDTGAEAARNGLIGLVRLYAAALELSPAEDASEVDAESASDVERIEYVDDAEWRAVRTHAARLPLDYYGEIFDPLPVPPLEPCLGSLSDDIADIYGDVVSGLRKFRAGHENAAVQDWIFGLQTHWGEHATSAIRALHCWLAKHDFEQLLKGP